MPMERTPPRNPAPDPPGGPLWYIFLKLVDFPGRRNVRIFGLSREEMVVAAVLVIFPGIPLAVFVATFPFWDDVAAWAVTRWLVAHLAPAIANLSDPTEHVFGAPMQRIVVALACMVVMVLLSCFVALASRGVRRQALLVWLCFPRETILQYLYISAIGFCANWFLVFGNFTFLASLSVLAPPVVIGLPLMAIIFGHIAAVVALGTGRDAAKRLRRLRARPQ